MDLFSSYTAEDLSVWSKVTSVREWNRVRSGWWPGPDWGGTGGLEKEFGVRLRLQKSTGDASSTGVACID